jgi:hypothetical protein
MSAMLEIDVSVLTRSYLVEAFLIPFSEPRYLVLRTKVSLAHVPTRRWSVQELGAGSDILPRFVNSVVL